jgi:flavin reductase (DIM6/NTAB) family NADH-FMN oxidoreductase RutF
MTFDSKLFRAVLGRFTTGIAVVTTRAADGTPIGMTVNSLTSVSLDPPLVLYCLGRDSQNYETFAGAEGFAFSILGEGQEAVSARFARRDLQDRFNGIAVSAGVTGAPLIDGALATIDCRRERAVEAGDHLIVIGRVVHLAAGDGAPLAYFRGGYARLG